MKRKSPTGNTYFIYSVCYIDNIWYYLYLNISSRRTESTLLLTCFFLSFTEIQLIIETKHIDRNGGCLQQPIH